MTYFGSHFVFRSVPPPNSNISTATYPPPTTTRTLPPNPSTETLPPTPTTETLPPTTTTPNITGLTPQQLVIYENLVSSCGYMYGESDPVLFPPAMDTNVEDKVY